MWPTDEEDQSVSWGGDASFPLNGEQAHAGYNWADEVNVEDRQYVYNVENERYRQKGGSGVSNHDGNGIWSGCCL